MKDLEKRKEMQMEERMACQEALREIFEDPELTVEEVAPQNSAKNQQGHSITLDVLCKRADGSFFNIEVQKQTMPII